jgi:hypothetical protein
MKPTGLSDAPLKPMQPLPLIIPPCFPSPASPRRGGFAAGENELPRARLREMDRGANNPPEQLKDYGRTDEREE